MIAECMRGYSRDRLVPALELNSAFVNILRSTPGLSSCRVLRYAGIPFRLRFSVGRRARTELLANGKTKKQEE